ncbi:unnamed protein product, partial [Notodromas monacha]
TKLTGTEKDDFLPLRSTASEKTFISPLDPNFGKTVLDNVANEKTVYIDSRDVLRSVTGEKRREGIQKSIIDGLVPVMTPTLDSAKSSAKTDWPYLSWAVGSNLSANSSDEAKDFGTRFNRKLDNQQPISAISRISDEILQEDCDKDGNSKPFVTSEQHHTDGRIVGGQTAKHGQFPFVISASFHGNHLRCGGSILTETFILTAAHCCSGAEGATIHAGNHNINEDDGTEQIRSQVDVIIHEGYAVDRRGRPTNDVCLLKLHKPLTFDDFVSPIGLPSHDLILLPGASLLIIGWGRLSYGGGSPSELQWAEVNHIDFDVCKGNYSLSFNSLTEDMICAGVESGTVDTCQMCKICFLLGLAGIMLVFLKYFSAYIHVSCREILEGHWWTKKQTHLLELSLGALNAQSLGFLESMPECHTL